MRYAISFVEVTQRGLEVRRIPYQDVLYRNATAEDITASPRIGDTVKVDSETAVLLEGTVRTRRFLYAGSDCVLEIGVCVRQQADNTDTE
jgi:hypothetical protein